MKMSKRKIIIMLSAISIVIVATALLIFHQQMQKKLFNGIRNNDCHLVAEALRYGANPNTVMYFYKTPLSIAIENGNLQMIDLLLSHHASVTVFIGEEYPIPIIDCAVATGNKTIVQRLLNYGAVLSPDSLIIAAKSGDIKMMEYILKHWKNIDINALGRDGYAAMHRVSSRDAALYLYRHGADINVRDSDGNTPLHYAAVLYHYEVIKTLLQLGVDKSKVNKRGENTKDFVFRVSAANKSRDIVLQLIK